ncbi:unnamed protein product [Ixodes pacificus]
MYLRRIFDGWTRLKTTAVPTIFQHDGRQHRKVKQNVLEKHSSPSKGTGGHQTLPLRLVTQQTAPCFPKETAILPDEGLTLRLQDTSHEKNNGACRNFTKSILKPVDALQQTFATKVPPGSNAPLRSLLRFRKDGDAATQARSQTFATKVPPGSNAPLRSLLRLRKNGEAATQVREQIRTVPFYTATSLRLSNFSHGYHFQTDLPSTMRDKATATSSSLRDTGTDPMDV